MRLPTEKAHGIQIMKTCESLAKKGATLLLVVPKRRTAIIEPTFTYYAVDPVFSIKKISVVDTVSLGKLGFFVENISFLFSIFLHYTQFRNSVLYSRDEMVLAPLAFFRRELVVWESHSGTWNIFSKYLARRADRIIVISHGLKQFYLGKGIEKERIIVAPDGVDVTAFLNPPTKEESRKRLGLSDTDTLALYVGRVDGWKGVGVLLKAARLLPSSIRVVIIGGEPHQVDRLKKENPSVIFLGYRPYTEISANLAAADMLVLPNVGTSTIASSYTSPLKLFAYMASGRPIVLSDLPSLKEILSEDSAEFFEAGNPTALAEAIERVAAGGNSVELKAATAKQLVEKYSWDKRAQTIYEAII